MTIERGGHPLVPLRQASPCCRGPRCRHRCRPTRWHCCCRCAPPARAAPPPAPGPGRVERERDLLPALAGWRPRTPSPGGPGGRSWGLRRATPP
eukprot:4396242-Lingulodinium_polyedra.AAC.1